MRVILAMLIGLCAVNVQAFVQLKTSSGHPVSMKKVMRNYSRIGWSIRGKAPPMLRESINFAVATWHSHSNDHFVFAEALSNYQIEIVWDTAHEQRELFLAYTNIFADVEGNAYYVKVVVCAQYNWNRDPQTDGGSVVAANLDSVMLHEFGHILGLGHADDDASAIVGEWTAEDLPTMWSMIYPGASTLHADDIAGLHAIYGSKPMLSPVRIAVATRNGCFLAKRWLLFFISEPGLAEWDFGDGTKVITSKSTLRHKYTSPGTYRVTVSLNGKTGETELEITKRKKKTERLSRLFAKPAQ